MCVRIKKESRNISVSDEAYHKLKDIKMKNDSFTDIINRLIDKTSVPELRGLVSGSEADSIHSSIKESRKISRKRMGNSKGSDFD